MNLLMQSLGNAVFRNRLYVLINFLLCACDSTSSLPTRV